MIPPPPNFLLILCEFYIMHTSPTHLQSLHTHSLTLQPPPIKNLTVEAVVCHSVSHSIPFFILLYLQMVIAMTPWFGIRPLASTTLSTLEP